MTDQSIYIYHGSRTGNSRAAAELANEYANYLGIESHLEDMYSFNQKNLENARYILIAVSTHGEGDPPLRAEPFIDFLDSLSGNYFRNINYSILALGDSSYKNFCKTGKDIAQKLDKLGATSIIPLVECDIDFENKAIEWARTAIDKICKLNNIVDTESKDKKFVFKLKLNDKGEDNYKAVILEKRLLTSEGSSKRIFHLSLDLENSGMDYLPGDSIGIICPNSKLYVDHLLRELKFDPAYKLHHNKEEKLLKEVLVKDIDLTLLTPVVIEKYAALVSNPDLDQVVKDRKKAYIYSEQHDVLDLVSDFPGKIGPEDFISILRKLAPRLFSVSSSRRCVGNCVDLAAGIIEYEVSGRHHIGVCSSFISDRLTEGMKVSITLERNLKFRLPENPAIPVIMIGTGTGVSPYRAFLQERAFEEDTRSWLIFGDRNAATDFIYKEDFKRFAENEVLSRLDTTFSRDREQKRYVTHIIRQQSKLFWKWIQEGAFIYICGNKRTMAYDVRNTITEVIQKEAGVSRSEATSIFNDLRNTRRIREDVY